MDINVCDFLESSARRYPQKIAFRQGRQSSTYDQFRRRVNRAANAMLAGGVPFQGRIAILCPNCISYAEIMFAGAKIGAVSELLNWRLAPVWLCEVLEESPAEIVFISRQCARVYEYLREHLRRPVRFISLGEGGLEGAVDYEAFLAGMPERCPGRRARASDLGFLVYTSGTTSRQKGVLHTVGNFVTKSFITQGTTRWQPDDVYLLTSPLFHISCCGLFTCVLAGATCVIGEPGIERIADAISADGVTRVGGVPTVIMCLIDHLEAHPEKDHASVRVLEYGAAPMTVEQVSRCRAFFHCALYQFYGLTETVAHVTLLLPEHHLDESRLRSAGLPVLGTELRAVSEEGTACGPGEIGEIAVRHPCTMKEYLNNQALTGEVLRDGWFYTGDLGYLDQDGFLFLVDRKNDMIISGGENIYPKEIAACISAMEEDIADVAVTGVPHPVWGEAVMAAVVRKPGSAVTAEQITARCGRELAGYKKPRFIYFLDSIPVNSLGKVDKAQLRAYHRAQMEKPCGR